MEPLPSVEESKKDFDAFVPDENFERLADALGSTPEDPDAAPPGNPVPPSVQGKEDDDAMSEFGPVPAVIEPVKAAVPKQGSATGSPSAVAVLQHTLDRIYMLMAQCSEPYVLNLLVRWRGGGGPVTEFQKKLRLTRCWSNSQIEEAYFALTASAPHLSRFIDAASVIELRLLHAALGHSEATLVLPMPSRIFHRFLTSVCQQVFLFPTFIGSIATSGLGSIEFGKSLTEAWKLAVYSVVATQPLQQSSPLMGNTSADTLPTAPPPPPPPPAPVPAPSAPAAFELDDDDKDAVDDEPPPPQPEIEPPRKEEEEPDDEEEEQDEEGDDDDEEEDDDVASIAGAQNGF